ncbi:CAP-Gly domain-containing linker protein 4 isoform X2 [Xenopus laevis]|uniref:CAP-Gly domain-containing linker protein 4 isoform X2 n=1 Tax=Xenopus laevis TaxID=8355 RepID=A0A8J1KV85_XENLA|nr:CAP-Gly domain-containing linker protein 4 isoform X2 [Xenopus laevis]
MTIEDLGTSRLGKDSLSIVRNYRAYYVGCKRPVTFSISAAPMPSDCEFSFFDPNDASCQDILFDPNTSISELFAILRQWVPQVQQSIDVIGNEILKRGCGVNDRDGLTDMTLLHYTCKSGAQGIGDAETAAKFASRLINLGADINLRSRWTNMNALHYAAYFDVPELLEIILKNSKPKDVDATCSDFDFGTALHIAASNLCLAAVKSLLEHGANPAFRDDRGQVPTDVVPDPVDMPLETADAAAVAKEIKKILLNAIPLSCYLYRVTPASHEIVPCSASLLTAGLKIGDRVLIAGQKVGTLRFCGSTEFASGRWAGIEMDESEGKNDGRIGGVTYFKCPPKHGIFAPLSKISRASDSMRTFIKSSSAKTMASVKSQKLDLSRVTPKINTGLGPTKKNSLSDSIQGSETSDSVTAKKVSYVGTSSLSSSTSSSSVEAKLHLSNHLRHRSSNNHKISAPFRSKSSSLRTINGLKARAPSVGSLQHFQAEFHLGDRVLVVGQRIGTVRFYGKTSFAPGFWCGIELDKAHGKNNGSISGVQYFTCPPKHGVFAPPSRVQRVSGSVDSLSEIPASKLNHSFPGFRRSYSSTSTRASQREADRRHSLGRPKKPTLRRSWSSTVTTNSSSIEDPVKLLQGSQVLLTSSNEIAVIRYIGPTDFAPGVWLGLELRNAKGKNDGSVGAKQYFHCKPKHGILVRPSRVTYRGINGSKLVDGVC